LRIAVTGATGGLGRSLTEFLLQQNCEVAALGRNAGVGRELFVDGADFHGGNIADVNYVTEAFKDCDVVVHSAGFASPFGSWETFYEANVQGTASVLQAMRANKINKLIHISTPSLYFSGEPRLNIRESDPLPTPQGFYARSKRMADEMVLKEVDVRGLCAVLIRPRAIFGKYDTTVLPRMMRILKKGFFPLPSGGLSQVDITAVENVVHAIWLAIQSTKQFRGDAFNITNGEPMTIRDLTKRLASSLDLSVRFVSVPFSVLIGVAQISEFFAKNFFKREPAISKYAIQSIGTTQTLNIEKAERELGYKPVISVDSALKKYINGLT